MQAKCHSRRTVPRQDRPLRRPLTDDAATLGKGKCERFAIGDQYERTSESRQGVGKPKAAHPNLPTQPCGY